MTDIYETAIKKSKEKKPDRFAHHILDPGIILLYMVTRIFVIRFHQKKVNNSKCLHAGFRVTRVCPDPPSVENRV